MPRRPQSPLFPYTTLFRSGVELTSFGIGPVSLESAGDGGGRTPDDSHVRSPESRLLSSRHRPPLGLGDRKSTRLNSSHPSSSYAVSCLKKKSSLPSISCAL